MLAAIAATYFQRTDAISSREMSRIAFAAVRDKVAIKLIGLEGIEMANGFCKQMT
jgi:hypothetical protein